MVGTDFRHRITRALSVQDPCVSCYREVMKTTEQDILNFWFHELKPPDWFKKDLKLDETIKTRFNKVLIETIAGEYANWRATAKGSLAQVIVLDQFSRNIFRDSPQAFSQDSLALAIAQDTLGKKFDLELSSQERAFLYMPFMHSESLEIHKQAVTLFSLPGLEKNLEFEYKHKAIIERFGRYPHRNKILGRPSTSEEEAFLKEPNSSF